MIEIRGMGFLVAIGQLWNRILIIFSLLLFICLNSSRSSKWNDNKTIGKGKEIVLGILGNSEITLLFHEEQVAII